MDTQVLRTPLIVYELTDPTPTPLAQACSCDYGFDYDEEEIAREMLAPLPVNCSSQATPEVGVDEFEQVFPCFLS